MPYQQFLFQYSGNTSGNEENRCPPSAMDNRKCRVCDCAMRSEATLSSHACTLTPKNCPSKWWMTESADTHETNNGNGNQYVSRCRRVLHMYSVWMRFISLLKRRR
ncbi:hypothetical protein DPMN_022802 [Dreissena polymorpha]|uniref:Uncharacterized protein n=1 Tax=Dreissena polymorpha TaxID=45954 RepID=A0A9D4NN26_DREPO|nr:hypothetical protein DPMN_022802 [Dreissena polymorpha]